MKVLEKVPHSKANKSGGLVLILLLIIALKSFLGEHCFIPTGSMMPTIMPGDIILATKYDYGYSINSLWPIKLPMKSNKVLFSSKPERGDIIIIRTSGEGLFDRIFGKPLIKRLVGLPGDKLQFINGMLFINDIAVSKDFVSADDGGVKYKETLPEGKNYIMLENGDGAYNSAIFHVPDQQYFFLGDNRDNSADSRYSLGSVNREQLVAKAKCILLRTNKSINPLNWCLKSSLKSLLAATN
jgi:signal peptidase I